MEDETSASVVSDGGACADPPRGVSRGAGPSPEQLLSCAGEGILGLDAAGRMSYVNPAGTELIGASEEALRGSRICTLLHPPAVAEHEDIAWGCHVCAAFGQGTQRGGEGELTRPDGTILPVWLSCRPIVSGDAVRGAVVVFEDVSERRRTEKALRRSEAEYRELVERAAVGIFRSTPDGRLLTVNRALVTMLGYESSEALMSVNLRDVYVDPQERDALIGRHGTEEQQLSEVVRWRHRDGTELRVRISWRPIEDEDGKVVCFEDFVQDVTEAALRERQLRHSQKMEAVGQLTAGIAHDFNNELLVILLSAQMISEAAESGRAVRTEDVRILEESAQRAAGITRQLLSFSRHADLAPEAVGLRDLLDGLSCILRTILPETIELSMGLGQDRCPAIVDPTAVEQSVLNLVSNARDAMPEGGMVQVGVRRHEVRVAGGSVGGPPPGTYARVSVIDSGVGMGEEVLARVFDPFFTTKPEDEGTGLGLAMVYGLTHQQGGYATVDSRPGGGSSFELWFPYAEGACREGEDPSSTRPAVGGSEVILVVEDDVSVLKAAERSLRLRGYSVLAAESAEVALEVLGDAGRVDLVLSDLGLPAMSGLDLRRELEQLEPGLPVIIASGYSRREAEERYGLDRSIPFVQKPWDLDHLLSLIRRGIDGESPPRRESQ